MAQKHWYPFLTFEIPYFKSSNISIIYVYIQPEFFPFTAFFIPIQYTLVIDQYPKYLYLIGSFFRNKKNSVNEKTQAVYIVKSIILHNIVKSIKFKRTAKSRLPVRWKSCFCNIFNDPPWRYLEIFHFVAIKILADF